MTNILTNTPTVSIVTVTPDMAREWLELNEDNRALRKQRVASYAADMKANRWTFTGEAIKFNGSTLEDGQHRLTACVLADTPFETLVIRGLPEGAKDVMDQGLPRTVSDVLTWHGGKNGNQVAAIARAVLLVRAGRPPTAQHAAVSLGFTRQVIAQFALEHSDELSEVFNFSRRNRFGANYSAVGAFLYLVGDLMDDPSPSMEFIESVASGTLLMPGDAQLALRNWMMNAGSSTKRARGLADHLAAIIRGWNGYVSGKPVKLIKSWIRSQPFPEIDLP